MSIGTSLTSDRLVALYCVNLAKLELHFPEFSPYLSLGKDQPIFAYNLESGSRATVILLLSEGR